MNISKRLTKGELNTMIKRPKPKTDGHIGKVIREHRTKKGLTQTELAKLIGTDQRSLSKWESGIYDPTATFLLKLIKTLDIDISALL